MDLDLCDVIKMVNEFADAVPDAESVGMKTSKLLEEHDPSVPMMLTVPPGLDNHVDVSAALWNTWQRSRRSTQKVAKLGCWFGPELSHGTLAWMLDVGLHSTGACVQEAQFEVIKNSIFAKLPDAMRTMDMLDEIKGVAAVLCVLLEYRDARSWHLDTVLHVYLWYRSNWRVANDVATEVDQLRMHVLPSREEPVDENQSEGAKDEFKRFVEYETQLEEEMIALSATNLEPEKKHKKEKPVARSQALESDIELPVIQLADDSGYFPKDYTTRFMKPSGLFKLGYAAKVDRLARRKKVEESKFNRVKFSFDSRVEIVDDGERFFANPLANRKVGRVGDIVAELFGLLFIIRGVV